MQSIKQFVLLVSVLLLSASLSAQSFSIKGGVNFGSVSDSKFDWAWLGNYETTPLTSFHLGASMDLPISPALSLRTGLQYGGRGCTYGFQKVGGSEIFFVTMEATTQIFYADIPLGLKVSFNKNGCEMYALGGGYFGLGLHGYEIREYNRSDREKRKITFGKEGFYNRPDYGAFLGFGLHFGAIFLEAKYNHGFANINNKRDSDPNDNRHRWLSLSLGYRLGE